ncbi:hypothetical protein Btru_063444 [Bulinus truncatus]|nr:hypothetical protein Btru_063444 [Bulinus truncatus]
MFLGGVPSKRVENGFYKCRDNPVRIVRSNEKTKCDSPDSEKCRALLSSTEYGKQRTSYYTLEIMCFSPRLCASRTPCSCVASMGDSERPVSTPERVSPVVPLWKTLRRNSSGLKGSKLFTADGEVAEETTAYIVAAKDDGEAGDSYCSSGSRSDCCGIPCCARSAETALRYPVIELYMSDFMSSPPLNYHRGLPGLMLERDFCNSQSSPENVKAADNMLLKSPKQKPSKKSSKSSKEIKKKKLPKYLSPPERYSFLIKSPRLEKVQGDKKCASPKLSPESVKSKTKKSANKKQSNSTSLSLRTATVEHTQANAHSTNSSDTVAIALNKVTTPKTKHGDGVVASSDTSPKAKQFSEEAEKMLSITKRTVCNLAACSQDDRSDSSSSSDKSCRSVEDDSDTKPSVSSFSASHLPEEKKSSIATNATQGPSMKLTEELAENVEASPTSSEEESPPSSLASHRDVTAPSSPRREERDEASPTEIFETGSNFMTKISDVSGSFISNTLSSTHTRKHGRHTLGSAQHKRNTGEGSIGSKKFRRPRAYGQNSEGRTSPSPHKKAIRSVSCPMNPMTTPEYIEATKNTVIGSSSSFLQALRGQRSWVPNVVTWFQGLFSHERDTSRMSSLVTSKDDIEAPKIDRLSPCLVRVESRQSGQEDSFSSIVLDKLRPTGRWASAKVSTLFRLDGSSRECRDVGAIPALTSASCMICPPEDEGPCPFSAQDDFDCDDDMPSPLNPQVTRNKTPPILNKIKTEKDKKITGKSTRRKAPDTENPATLFEDHRQSKTPPKSSPSKKPCFWQQSPKKGDSDAVSKQRRDGKKSSIPQCIWEVPEPPQTDQEESSDVCGKVAKNDPGFGGLDGTTPMHIKEKVGIEEADPFIPGAMENYFADDDHERYSIASLDYEGIGDIDERPNKQEEKNQMDLVNWSGFLSPSIASFAMSTAGNTIWSQLEKIREANVKYQFPQRRGLYEPPKAYPIWLYAEHIQKFLGFFGKGKDADDQKDANRVKKQSETEPKKSSFDENVARTAEELRQAKEKEAKRDSTSSWASNVTAQPKVEEPVHFPQIVDNFRELRLCYPSLPLPLNRHPMHHFCHQHCCYLQRRPTRRHQTHKCQSFATCSQCPTHGATFRRRRSSSPQTPTCQGDYNCCLYGVCSRPMTPCSPGCYRQRRPRLPRCSQSRKEIRKLSSCPVKPKTTPWATCCAKVMKLIQCDAFSQSELKRKPCLLSEKGDRYYYKNLFRKRINMRNFMKEMKRASTVMNAISPDNDAGGNDDGEGRVSPPVKCPEKCESQERQFNKTDYRQEGSDSPCGSKLNNYTIASLSPCKKMVNDYTVSPCNEILKRYSVSPCKEMFDSIRLSCTPMCGYLTACKTDAVEDKMDQSKNKCDVYDNEMIHAAEDNRHFTPKVYNHSWETAEKAKFNINVSHESMQGNWDSSKLLTSPLHRHLSRTENLNVSSGKQFSSLNSCAPPPRETGEENIFQCPCGINFVQPCSVQCELAFNRNREHLVSKIKSGNIEPTGNQVLPFAGPYRYEELHAPMSQLKADRYKAKNDFRHSSFLYEDVLRDKFIPSRDQDEGCFGRRQSEFKRPAPNYESSPLKAEQIAQDVLATLPRVSYKPPIYRRGLESQSSSSRRYDASYNKCMGRNVNFKRDASENATGSARNYGDSVDLAWKSLHSNDSSNINSSNLFMGRHRDNDMPDGSRSGKSLNIADFNTTSSIASRLLSYHHNYISNQTASLLHGTGNYGNLLSSGSKSNVFIIRQRDNVLPGASRSGRSCNVADLNMTSSNASRPVQNNYISTQTASLLHGAANYGSLMSSTSKSAFPFDFNKKAAPSSFKNGTGYSLIAPSHYTPSRYYRGPPSTYNTRMPFPYNNAEKVMMTSSFHPPSTVKCSRRRFY